MIPTIPTIIFNTTGCLKKALLYYGNLTPPHLKKANIRQTLERTRKNRYYRVYKKKPCKMRDYFTLER